MKSKIQEFGPDWSPELVKVSQGVFIPRPPSITLRVLQRHIDGAESLDNKCMVALRLKDIPGAWGFEVTAAYTKFNIGEWRLCYPTAYAVAERIKKHDDALNTGRKPKTTPFSFRLRGDDGRACCVPVNRRGPQVKSKHGEGKNKGKRKAEVKKCRRRYHGYPVVVDHRDS